MPTAKVLRADEFKQFLMNKLHRNHMEILRLHFDKGIEPTMINAHSSLMDIISNLVRSAWDEFNTQAETKKVASKKKNPEPSSDPVLPGIQSIEEIPQSIDPGMGREANE